jgi:uncharacterized membrane protein YdjX (TVP38/TMEM64 family)
MSVRCRAQLKDGVVRHRCVMRTELATRHETGQAWVQDLWRPALLVGIVAAAWLAALVLGLGEKLGALRERIAEFGPAAPAVYIAVRAAAAVALVPGSPISGAAGVLFGPVVGVLCVSVGKTLGAGISFLVARHFARDAVSRWVAKHEVARRLDDLVAAHGGLVVALMRLWPVVPFSLQNYAFGLTRVSFPIYLALSWLCMLPGAVFVVTGTGVIAETLASGQVPWGLLGAFAASVVVIAVLGTYALARLVSLARRSPSRR